MKLKIQISTNVLKRILETVNTRIIKEIEIKECSNHIPFKLYWYEVTIGSRIYMVNVFDMDPYYTEAEISYVEQMIKEFSESPEHSELIIKRTR